MRGLNYLCTNENLYAIIAGLDLKPEDNILAITGSGDQAFAMLELVMDVTVVDINPAQIKYIKKRSEALKRGDSKTFLGTGFKGFRKSLFNPVFVRNLCNRNNYFQEDKHRLKKISAKLENLTILFGDVFNLDLDVSRFTRVYLSNIDIPIIMGENFFRRLKEGTLIYTSGGYIETRKKLEIDEVLSSKAKELECDSFYEWYPTVYLKTN